MKFFKKASATTIATTTTSAAKAAAQTARRVEFAKNALAIYGGVRLVLDVYNAVRVAKLIKSGQIYQGEDGYWYYADTNTPEVEEGGVEEEEAQ